MVNFKFNCLSATILCSTVLAGIFVSCENLYAECFPFSCQSNLKSFSSSPVSMSRTSFERVSFKTFIPRNHAFLESSDKVFKDFRVILWTKEWLMPYLKSNFRNGWMVGFSQSFIPNRLNPNVNSFCHINRLCLKNQEKTIKLGELLENPERTISSQAEAGMLLKVQRLVDEARTAGNSTTSAQPERDDIVRAAEESAEDEIKNSSITILNSIDYTKKLEDLSNWDPNNIFQKALRDDIADTLDRAAAVPFTVAKFVAVATSTASTVFTTNGTATATANANLSDKNVRDIVDYMKRKQTPKIGGPKGYYGAILSISSLRGIYDYLQAIAQYTEPEYRYNSEVGRYYDARMMEDNSVLSDAVGTSTAFGNGYFFGDDAILEAIAVPEYTVADLPTDLGRSRKIGWLATLAFKKTWDLTTDDLNSTGKGVEKIVRVTSAEA